MLGRWSLVLVVAACGSKPPVEEPIASRPVGPQTPSCTDAGAILRGPVSSDDPKAGPAREQAIAAACREDRWSADILACVVATRQPVKCVDKLTKVQQAAYQAKLDRWSSVYGGDMYGGDMYGGDGYGGMMARDVDCGDILADVHRYPPSLDPTAPEHDWVMTQRQRIVEHTCAAQGWAVTTRNCLADAVDGPAADACLKDEPSRPQLVKQLTDLDGLAARIAAAKKKPASITCAKVVDAHYGDARWKDKLAGVKTADRKKQIADSRKAMQKACTDEHWSDTARACIVVDDGDRCYDGGGVVWGYPASLANLPTECAQYRANVERMVSCDKLPQASRDALKQAFDQASAAWANLPPDVMPSLVPACRAGADAIYQVASATCGW